MNRRINILLAALFLLPAYAREDYVRNFDKVVPLPSGQRLRVQNKFGDVTVRTQNKAEVSIHAVIRSSASTEAEARRYADQIRIDVNPSGSGLLIETIYPKEEERWFHNMSYSVRYEIVMPENAPIEVRNNFGAVSVAGAKGGGEIVNSHGAVDFRDGRGNFRIEASFGPVQVAGNAGDLTVTNMNGTLDVADVSGRLDLRDRFGKVTVTRCGGGRVVNGNGAVELTTIAGDMDVTTSFGDLKADGVKGNLVVHNQNGKIEAFNVTGSAELYTSFGGVRFADIGGSINVKAGNAGIQGHKVGGSATLENSFGAIDVGEIRKGVRVIGQNGSVTVADAGGASAIKTSFGLVRADRVNGLLTVENHNGAVNASGIRGGADVRTTFGAVMLDGISGPVSVEDQNGSVEVNTGNGSGPCEPITVHTSFGPLRVRLPGDASYAVTARTSFSKVQSDFPMMVSGRLDSNTVSGKIGSGACPLNLTNQNGAIEIQKR